ncbi:hypothetical protein CVT25_001700 [Psilocybe cyanescens]|uniref:Uncharacterized protein n=1 Tax=Psilocybe cyanescens TaxID=93625 RepID=A0A409XHJ6_PSICY|nr:hypothetical protein CVT25_001700 [Psilocybe cyanescens]
MTRPTAMKQDTPCAAGDSVSVLSGSRSLGRTTTKKRSSFQPPPTSKTLTHLLAAPTVSNASNAINAINAARRHHRAHPLHLAITATPSVMGISAPEVSSASESISFARALEEPLNTATATAAALGGNTSTSSPKTRRKFSVGMELDCMRDRKSREHAKDLSDVVRRVGLSKSGLINDTSCTYAYATGGQGSFDICVDSTHVDPDISEIVLVKKSRVALDGVRTGEVTHVMKVGKEGGVLKEGQGKERLGQVKGKTGREREKEVLDDNWARREDSNDKKEMENKISHKRRRMHTQFSPTFEDCVFFLFPLPFLFFLLSFLCVFVWSSSFSVIVYAHSHTLHPSQLQTHSSPKLNLKPKAGNSTYARERAGSAATVNSTDFYNGPHSSLRTLSSTIGGMLAPPEALGSDKNVNAQGQGSARSRTA